MSKNRKLAGIILAAGQGKRMQSDLPKVLHEVGGKPLAAWVMETARAIGADPIVVVVGYGRELVESAIGAAGVVFAVQNKQLGTAHAVEQARPALRNFAGDVVVLSGDVPGISADTLRKLLDRHRSAAAKATVLSAEIDPPTGYGRIIRDKDGHLLKVVEEKDATGAERGVKEINGGIYVFDAQSLFAALPFVKNKNKQNEYYLPDILYILKEQNETIAVEKAENYREIQGVNTLQELRSLNDEVFS